MPTTYFIRKTGSDANAGTSAGAAWLTIGKALGAAGIASGDTVYIGAGVYREVVTVAMTSATAETKVYGDVDGVQTGDAGEIQWTGFTTNDTSTPSATALLTLAGRDFLTFRDIVFVSSASVVNATTNTSTDIKFTRCYFIQAGTGVNITLNITSAANVALNWVIDSCVVIKAGATFITYVPVRPATADFDINLIIKNCLIIGASGGITIIVSVSGANAFNPGGILTYNCTHIAGNQFMSVGASWSTTIPCTIYNCLIYNGTGAMTANTSGQIIEDYNIIVAGASPRTNVTAGSHSKSDGSVAPLFFTGHEYYSIGANIMPFGMPKPGSPLLGFGNQASSPTTDIIGAARPSGFVKLATGTATSGAVKTITLSTAAYGTNVFAGATIKIISGTGSSQPPKTIASNTATVITVDGNWITQPDNTSVFEVYLRATASGGTFTAGSTTTGTDGNAAWGVNQWQGYTMHTDSGTGSGQTLLVLSNTATVLTWAAATAVDNTTTYSLYRGTGVNVINAGVGCYEYGSSSVQDTITFLTSPNSWCIPGAGYQDFYLEVRAVATSITVYAQYDAAYSGTLPSVSILNGTQCGVSNATATQVGAASTWEVLVLSFTPTANGFITLRLVSSSTTPTGNAYFDQFIPFN